MAEVAPREQATAAPTPTVTRGFWHTRWFLVAFYALAVVWGVRNVRFWEPSALDQLIPIALAICLGWWAIVDARRRRHPIPMLARPWFFLLAGLVVPGYVIWSRRWRGAVWVILLGILWFGLGTIVMHVGGVIVFGDEWQRVFGEPR
jgi:hypothetical protein